MRSAVLLAFYQSFMMPRSLSLSIVSTLSPHFTEPDRWGALQCALGSKGFFERCRRQQFLMRTTSTCISIAAVAKSHEPREGCEIRWRGRERWEEAELKEGEGFKLDKNTCEPAGNQTHLRMDDLCLKTFGVFSVDCSSKPELLKSETASGGNTSSCLSSDGRPTFLTQSEYVPASHWLQDFRWWCRATVSEPWLKIWLWFLHVCVLLF